MKIDQKEKLSNTMIISIMASAKQIAWRKKFVKRYAKKGATKVAGYGKKKSASEKRAESKAKAYREESGERVILHKIKIVEKEIKKANRENKEISQAVHTTLFNIRDYAEKHNRPKLEREVKRLIKLMKNP